MVSYEDYALAHRRDVQCLTSADRNARKQALERLQDSFNIDFFLQEAQSGVFRLFSDPVDRVRETAVDLVAKLYCEPSSSSPLPEPSQMAIVSTLPTLVPLISNRLKSEPSEEIKQKLMTLLHVALQHSKSTPIVARTLTDYSGEVLESLRLGLGDLCPDLKKLSATAVLEVPVVFTLGRLHQSSAATKAVVSALIGNTKHTHWRVRTANVTSLCVFLSCQDSGAMLLLDFMTDILAFLGIIVNDRQFQVRREAFKSLGVWLTRLIAVSGGVASMVDGQYVLVDVKKEDRYIQSLLFHLLLGLTDEEESVKLEARDALFAVAQVSAAKKTGEVSQAVTAYVEKYRTMACGVDEFLVSVWTNAEVACLLTQYKTGLLQQTLANALWTRRALLVLSPVMVETLDAVVSLLVMNSEDADFAQLLNQTAVYMEYVVPIVGRSVAFYLNQQQFPLTNAALSVLRKLLQASGNAHGEFVTQSIEILQECVKEAIPRGVLAKNVGVCAEVLLHMARTSEDRNRLHSVLLRSETVNNLTHEIFNEVFFISEAASVSLPVLTILISKTATSIVKPHLVSSVLSRLTLNISDDERKTEVLEVLDVLVKKLIEDREAQPQTLAEVQFIGKSIDCVLMPYIEWRPGQANAKIRRGALVILLGVIDLLPSVGAEKTLMDYWNIFKSAMDDSWVPDNRYAAVIAVRKLMLRVEANSNSAIAQQAQDGSSEIFRDMYPELLKRLDDSQDPVRVEAANTIAVMFELIAALCPNEQQLSLLLSKSSVTYIVKALLVHLEDNNDLVWKAVEHAVAKAALVSRQGTVDELKAGEIKSSKPQRCATILASLV